jgi:hypothetical protein
MGNPLMLQALWRYEPRVLANAWGMTICSGTHLRKASLLLARVVPRHCLLPSQLAFVDDPPAPKRHSDPTAKERRTRPWHSRFMEKITVDLVTGCWNWNAPSSYGYGRFTMGVGEVLLAHRLAYQLWTGPIGDGWEIETRFAAAARAVTGNGVYP